MVNSKTGSGSGFQINGLLPTRTQHFKPARIEMRDVRSGTVIPLTVIGVLRLGSRSCADGLSTPVGVTLAAAARSRRSRRTTYFFRVAPGQNVHTDGAGAGLGLPAQRPGRERGAGGVRPEPGHRHRPDTTCSKGFMALGLVVGIAALGVIATRSVVERRQQIGMLRAIGFKRRMVRASFLLESSFVALLGTVLGVVLGLLLAPPAGAQLRQDRHPGLQLVVPWAQVALIVVLRLRGLAADHLSARLAGLAHLPGRGAALRVGAIGATEGRSPAG